MPEVLVLDDSALMRVFLRRSLEKEELEVEAWLPPTATKLPDRIRKRVPDLIKADFQMPVVRPPTSSPGRGGRAPRQRRWIA